MQPIFMFSLPRSGSTLLQRMLASHSKISSTSEPWVALPILYTLKTEGTITNYSYKDYRNASTEFFEKLPEGVEEYKRSINKFLTEIYEKQSLPGALYFLDKTPRYYHIIKELNEVFPEAKFIFLFRNPIQIYSSIIKTFCQDKFIKEFNYHTDLFEGQKLITKGYVDLKEKSILVNYEALVEDPKSELMKIVKYLNLEWEDNLLNFQSLNLKGKYGDPTGVKEFKKVSSEALRKWQKIIRNPYRRLLLKKYLRSIGKNTLDIQGYDLETLMKEISNSKISFEGVVKDFLHYKYSYIVRITKAYLLFGKTAKWSRGKNLS